MNVQGVDVSWTLLVQEHLQAAALGLARILPCMIWLPYLGSGAIASKMLRAVVAVVIFLGLFPQVSYPVEPPQGFALLLVMLGETVLGTILGMIIALPYVVFHAVGAIIDSQRGASVSSMLDPLTGVEATEMSNLLQLAAAAVFLATGGMLGVLQMLQASYALVPMGARFVIDIDQAHAYAPTVLGAMLRIAGPVLVLLLLTEILLGVLSRFAQQMNAFSLTLSVKSLIAFAALLVYLFTTMGNEVPTLWQSMTPDAWFGPVAEDGP